MLLQMRPGLFKHFRKPSLHCCNFIRKCESRDGSLFPIWMWNPHLPGLCLPSVLQQSMVQPCLGDPTQPAVFPQICPVLWMQEASLQAAITSCRALYWCWLGLGAVCDAHIHHSTVWEGSEEDGKTGIKIKPFGFSLDWILYIMATHKS